MIEALTIAVVLSWIAIIGLCLTVYALTRQIGLLHDRIKPVGALSLGQTVQVGDAAPRFALPSLNGGETAVGGASSDGRGTLLFFLSSTCPVCKELLPSLKSLAAAEKSRLRLVFASDGAEEEHRDFIARHRLERFPYLLSAEAGVAYRIGKLPYGVMISAAGTVLSHGLVNSREHVDSLLAALEIEGAPA